MTCLTSTTRQSWALRAACTSEKVTVGGREVLEGREGEVARARREGGECREGWGRRETGWWRSQAGRQQIVLGGRRDRSSRDNGLARSGKRGKTRAVRRVK